MTRFFSQVILERTAPAALLPVRDAVAAAVRCPRCGTSSPARPGSSARTWPRRSRAAGHDVVGIDCFTDYYDPALKEENARGLDIRPLDLAEDELDFRGFDGVFHLAGPAGRAELRRRLPDLPAPERARLAARVRGRGARRRAGRVRVVVVDLRRRRALPDAGGAPSRSRSRRTGSRSSPASISRRRTRASSGSTASCSATSTRSGRGSGPTWRSRGSSTRSRRARRSSSTATATSRAAGRTSATSSTRRSLAMERGTGTYNVGGALEASLNESIALLERISGRTLEVERAAGRGGRPAPHERRHDAGSRRELGWRPAVSLEDGLRAQWEWAATRVAARMSADQVAVGSRAPSARSTSGAGSTRFGPAGGSPLSGSSIGAVIGAVYG